ncbi:MAG: HAD family acid phosphatase, partial [Candidatus Erginobacter occultus]|nr:HAD family acid phosphatase [Candidatus Erginobacter occultus]
MKSRNKLFLVILVVLAISIPVPGSAETVTLPNDISWVYAADTYRGSVQQAYLNAINRVKVLAEGKKPGTWCVVLDADETIISNVQFQAEQAAKGEGYSRDAWNAWCQRMEATALPGAIEFLTEVRNLGGKIIIVTNRQAPLGEPTVKNLEKVGIPFDVCLLREGV